MEVGVVAITVIVVDMGAQVHPCTPGHHWGFVQETSARVSLRCVQEHKLGSWKGSKRVSERGHTEDLFNSVLINSVLVLPSGGSSHLSLNVRTQLAEYIRYRSKHRTQVNFHRQNYPKFAKQI